MLTCTFENQGTAHLRHVAVHAIAIQAGKILLVKRAPNLINGNKYGFPGGYLELDETVAEGCLRELKEETGYDGQIEALFSICDNPHRQGEDRQNVAFSYLVTVGEKTGQPDHESTAVEWFDLDDLPAEPEFAFDHWAHLAEYQKYAHQPQNIHLPIMISK